MGFFQVLPLSRLRATAVPMALGESGVPPKRASMAARSTPSRVASKEGMR